MRYPPTDAVPAYSISDLRAANRASQSIGEARTEFPACQSPVAVLHCRPSRYCRSCLAQACDLYRVARQCGVISIWSLSRPTRTTPGSSNCEFEQVEYHPNRLKPSGSGHENPTRLRNSSRGARREGNGPRDPNPRPPISPAYQTVTSEHLAIPDRQGRARPSGACRRRTVTKSPSLPPWSCDDASIANHRRISCAPTRQGTEARRGGGGRVVAHSDHGSQCGSDDFKRFCQAQNLEQSTSRRNNCWDNAVAGSFFSSPQGRRQSRGVRKRRCVRQGIVCQTGCSPEYPISSERRLRFYDFIIKAPQVNSFRFMKKSNDLLRDKS